MTTSKKSTNSNRKTKTILTGRTKPKKKATPSLVPEEHSDLLPDHNWDQCDPNDLTHPSLYINRELSWCQFNQRVLDQAYRNSHPLLERVKFLAIVGSNLDEFFMIRVATILKKLRAGLENITPDGLTTTQQFWAIRERVQQMLDDQTHCWTQILRPELAKESIHFIELADYTQEIKEYLAHHFKKEIYPTLTPLAFDPGHPFPHISNLSLNLAVVVHHNEQVKFARVKIPSLLPRFIRIPEDINPHQKGDAFVFLEDVIRANIQELFPGTHIEECYLFRVTRDTDIVIQEDEADDLLESIDRSLKQIRYGAVSLLQVESSMPKRILDILAENFQVFEAVITSTNDRMGFSQWMSLMKLHRPQLKDSLFSPPSLFTYEEEPETIFDRIKYQDQFVHHPYESFTSLEAFIKAAVDDPDVVAIKMTLYRIGSNSPIVDHLIQATENGKQVAVLVELKARFDEKSNIVWAKRMESVGVHVVYGLLNLKTHCKLCLVVRKETDGIRRYVHIGTGNYNRANSRIYTDVGVFTANEEVTEDVSQVFNYLTGYSNKRSYNHLLVAPVSLRSGLVELIEREAQHAKAGRPSRVIIKNNAITHPIMIQALYRASQANVKIDLIVRGICCLRPGIPGISENIRVYSVVGRFLEHSRIYYFENGGEPEIYIGSADFMERNLDRRVEVISPLLDPRIRNYCKTHILDVMLEDNQQSSELQTDGSYTTIERPKGGRTVNTQKYLLNWHTSKRNSDTLTH